jgi:hypothetical protein
MNHTDLTQKVEEIYQARLKNPADFHEQNPKMAKEWKEYYIDCLSVERESLYKDFLNSHDIPFVRKAMIMCSGEVLAEDDYAAWYFTYPELVKEAQKLLSAFGWQCLREELKASILALSPIERECFDRVCKHGAFKGKTDRALLKALIEKKLVTKSKYYVDRKHWMWQYNPDSHLLKEVWSEL